MNNTKLLLILGTAACITCGCAKTTAFGDEVLLSNTECLFAHANDIYVA